jgi:MacB-like periplasmic core domain
MRMYGIHLKFQMADRPDEDQIPASFSSVTPGYFAALGIPLRRGRGFTEQGREGAPRVAIIDEQLARQAFGDGDPLGRRIRFGPITDQTPWREIVGVVGHIRANSLETDPRPQLYWPEAQQVETQFTQYRVALVITVAWLVAPVLLLVTALLAGFGPVRRAGRVDPANTLRHE